MKKFRRIKLLGLLVILSVTLVLLGINSARAGAKGKPTNWTAVILPESPNLKGMGNNWDSSLGGYAYPGGKDGISISNGKGWCGSGKDKTYYSYIKFEISLPSQILFLDLLFDAGNIDESLILCGFPTGGETWPDCLAAFLSWPQPYSDHQNEVNYHKVYFYFSTNTCPDRKSFDFMEMQVGTSKIMKLFFFIEGQNTSDCDGCNELYNHNIKGRAHGWKPDGENPDIFIRRDSTNEWTVVVNTDFNNPDYWKDYPAPYPYMNLRDQIFGQYCVCTGSSKGKGKQRKEFKEPGWTKAHMEFQIKFMKN